MFFSPDNPLPDSCTLEYQISERLTQKLLKTTKNAQLKMLAILNECEISNEDGQSTQSLIGLIITATDLYLLPPKYRWITDIESTAVDTADIECYQQQLMSNLIEIEKMNEQTLRINYLDENQDKMDQWTCTFETDESAESTLNAISQSWETLFGVPLGNN